MTKANMKEPYDVLLNPYVTEKSSNLMDLQNKLEFIVHKNASKKDIKDAFEKLYKAKVVKVNTFIAKDGKHAIIKLAKGESAEEIGMRIGIF